MLIRFSKQRVPPLFSLIAPLLLSTLGALVAAADEPFLAKPKPGVFVDRVDVVPDQTAQAIGTKLGGKIQRLSNNMLRIQGRTIKVNVITAVDEANAQKIEMALGKIKKRPFFARKGNVVVEYVGQDLDDAIATKASYELGVVEPPSEITYRVVAELALIDEADYMQCNPLFQTLLQSKQQGATDSQERIKQISSSFRFGNKIALRNTDSQPVADVKFTPMASSNTTLGPNTLYTVGAPVKQHGIPYVAIDMKLLVDDDGLTPATNAPDQSLTAATKYWPADDPQLLSLAQKITQGKRTNDDKAKALLQWLAPGKNLKYSGQTGSRWGTLKFIEQKFGHCWDFSDAFVSLARAAGVPSRQVAGWLYGSSGHVWCEYYSEGKGWQQVDPTGGGVLPCGLYHLAYFTTETGDMPIVYMGLPTISIEK